MNYYAAMNMANGIRKMADKIKELEAENARLRQQRDAANALLDYVLEEVSNETE